MATAYDFSNFTADDLLEAELAEEERVARSQARADASAGKLKAYQALMGQSQTARANVIKSDSDAASLKAYSTGKDVEHLSHIRQRMATAIEDGKLSLNDIKKFNIWYGEQNFPYRFEKDIRTAYNSMSGQRASEITATQTKKTFDHSQIDRTTEADYEATGEKANVLLNRIKDQYTTLKPGRQQLGKAQAIDQLTSGLIELGIKGKDLSSYTARLESVIKLTEEMRAGTVNKTAGRYATEIIKGLEDETYDYVQAMSEFSRLTAGLDPSSAGVKAARTALNDHISAMKYTQETLPVILRTGDYAGTVDFVTRKQLLEDMERDDKDKLYASTQGQSKLPPGMSLVAWMVTDPEVPTSKEQFIPNTFIQRMAVEGYGRIWALNPEERKWWNAWVEKYKEVNPDAMTQLIQALGGGTGGSGATFN